MSTIHEACPDGSTSVFVVSLMTIANKPSPPRYVPAPRHGDARRAKLLAALDDLLAQRPFTEVGIGEITAAAGVSRPAFYRYFTTKTAAVLALLEDFFDEMIQASSAWYEGGGDPARDRLQTTFETAAKYWRARAALLVALLDGVGSDPEVREIWNGWIEGYVDRVAEQITNEIEAGLVRPLPDPRPVAVVLVGAAVHVMERDVRSVTAGGPPLDDLVEAVTDTWHQTLYMSIADEAP